jgi:sugar phosphate isomerase/epimerase
MKNNKIHLGGTARSPEDVISLYELGLKFAEIPITNLEAFSALKGDYRSLMERLPFYYLCHGPQEGNPNDMETLGNAYLPELMRILSIMPELDMRLLTLHLWMDSRFVSREAIAYKTGLLKRVIDRASDSGITICVENLSESSMLLADIFKALPLLGLTLDLGHGELLSKENTSLGFMTRYPERIKHVHLHDNRGGDSQNDDLHLPVGDGIIDFGKIFKELKAIGYSGTITLELRPREIRKCLDHVKKLLLTGDSAQTL